MVTKRPRLELNDISNMGYFQIKNIVFDVFALGDAMEKIKKPQKPGRDYCAC